MKEKINEIESNGKHNEIDKRTTHHQNKGIRCVEMNHYYGEWVTKRIEMPIDIQSVVCVCHTFLFEQ